MHDIALPFRDFYVKFIRLDRELAYIENTLLTNLLNKLYPRLRVLVVNHDKFTTITLIKNYLINLNNQQRANFLKNTAEKIIKLVVTRLTKVSRSTSVSTSFITNLFKKNSSILIIKTKIENSREIIYFKYERFDHQ